MKLVYISLIAIVSVAMVGQLMSRKIARGHPAFATYVHVLPPFRWTHTYNDGQIDCVQVRKPTRESLEKCALLGNVYAYPKGDARFLLTRDSVSKIENNNNILLSRQVGGVNITFQIEQKEGVITSSTVTGDLLSGL